MGRDSVQVVMEGDGRSKAPAPATDDHDRIQDAVRSAGTSFYWAMRLLPEEKRRAMYGIYAFCRAVDDIADDPGSEPEKVRRLAEWRHAIDRVYAGTPDRAETRVLASAVDGYGLRREDLIAVIDGMEMDAGERIRLADWDALILYCDRVACAVGRLSVRVFGVGQPEGDQLAKALGEALQLTNILRDIKEDADRDRLYLPLEALREQGVDADGDDEVWAMLRHPGIPAVCETVSARAGARFDEARSILEACDRRKVRPARIMMEVYRRTYLRLCARGWRRWAEPVLVPSSEKLWVAVRYGVV